MIAAHHLHVNTPSLLLLFTIYLPGDPVGSSIISQKSHLFGTVKTSPMAWMCPPPNLGSKPLQGQRGTTPRPMTASIIKRWTKNRRVEAIL